METLKSNPVPPPSVKAVPKSEPMEICHDISEAASRQLSSSDATMKTEVSPAAAAPLKKKKKKASYKTLMASILTSDEKKDIAKEREALSKVTGGGAFSKIEKI